MIAVDVSKFQKVPEQNLDVNALMVVKSLNQLERRQKMVANLKGEKIGRVQQRPIEDGLVANLHFQRDHVEIKNTYSFREPRHIVKKGDFFYLSEVGRILKLNLDMELVDEYRHDFFAFLHTLDIKENKILVVSSGYDSLFEIDMETKEVVWEWFAWENGFNPDADGNYLVRTAEKEREYRSQGLQTFFVDPKKYNEYGLITSKRSAHPNVALYSPHDDDSIIISIALNGEIYEINKRTNKITSKIILNKMTHGIHPYEGGWIVTNTTKGEFLYLDTNFNIIKNILFGNMDGKEMELGDIEWIQQVVPYNEFLFVLDANRNLFVVNMEDETYTNFELDPNWCLQDMLIM